VVVCGDSPTTEGWESTRDGPRTGVRERVLVVIGWSIGGEVGMFRRSASTGHGEQRLRELLTAVRIRESPCRGIDQSGFWV
jgi:hypothetical protein